jgi:hypothetical protein
MSLAHRNDVRVNISQQSAFPQQPAWIANPQSPTSLICLNWTRLVGFPNSAQEAEKHQKHEPKLCKNPVNRLGRAHRRNGFQPTAARLSLMSSFLGQNGLQPAHLFIEHAFI